jgi:hypothetical protein
VARLSGEATSAAAKLRALMGSDKQLAPALEEVTRALTSFLFRNSDLIEISIS